MTPTPGLANPLRLPWRWLAGICLALFAASALAGHAASVQTLSDDWEFRLVPGNAQAEAHVEATA